MLRQWAVSFLLLKRLIFTFKEPSFPENKRQSPWTMPTEQGESTLEAGRRTPASTEAPCWAHGPTPLRKLVRGLRAGRMPCRTNGRGAGKGQLLLSRSPRSHLQHELVIKVLRAFSKAARKFKARPTPKLALGVCKKASLRTEPGKGEERPVTLPALLTAPSLCTGRQFFFNCFIF